MFYTVTHFCVGGQVQPGTPDSKDIQPTDYHSAMKSITPEKGKHIMVAAKYETVAEFLAWAIRRSGKTQREVARDVGYPKPNVVSMMKTGETRLPLERVPAFARALEIDAAFLMRMALQEYHPELYQVLIETLGKPLTANERAIVECYRRVAPHDDIEMDSFTQSLVQLTLDSRRIHAYPKR